MKERIKKLFNKYITGENVFQSDSGKVVFRVRHIFRSIMIWRVDFISLDFGLAAWDLKPPRSQMKIPVQLASSWAAGACRHTESDEVSNLVANFNKVT